VFILPDVTAHQAEVAIAFFNLQLHLGHPRAKTGRVKHWQDGRMALRWAASALDSIEKRMRRIMGYQQLWVLEASLDEKSIAMKERAA
jgi:hypothetical protein